MNAIVILIPLTVILCIAGIYTQRYFENRSRERQREADLDLIEEHGFKAHLYFPGVGIEDEQLYIALSRLNHSGYIFTGEDGGFLGKVSTARPSPDEIADSRRASFKIIHLNDETDCVS